MKNIVKTLSIGFVLVLLVMTQQNGVGQQAEAALAEDKVEWQSRSGGPDHTANNAAAGTKVKYFSDSDIGFFYIQDSDLNSVVKGATVYSCTASAATGDNVDASLHDDGDPTGTAANPQNNCTGTQYLQGAIGIGAGDTASGATPLNPGYLGTSATPLVPGTVQFSQGTPALDITGFDSLNHDTGDFLFNGALAVNIQATAATRLIAKYDYNINQTYAASGASDLQTRRAFVSSTSDPTGEWIAIQETSGAGGTAVTATDSKFFRGIVAFSGDATAAASGSTLARDIDYAGGGGNVNTPSVWVQDGDIVTVTFYAAGTDDNSDGAIAASEKGAVIATATATIDSGDPSITNVSPADGTLTKDTSPTVSFTINDSGIGFESSVANFGNHVDLYINKCLVLDTELSITTHSTSSIGVTFDLPGGSAKFSDSAREAHGGGGNVNCSNRTANGEARDVAASGFNVNTTSAAADTTLDRTIHGTKFSWEIIARDDVGNEKILGDDTGAANAEDLELHIDSVKPDTAGGSAVTTGKYWDTVTKAPKDAVNSIQVDFTESIDPASVQASDFVVSGTGVTDSTITKVTMGGDDGTLNKSIFLELAADLAPNALPKVELQGIIADLAGNEWNGATYTGSHGDDDGKSDIDTGADGVKPTVTFTASTDQYLDDKEETTITWTSNENMTAADGAAQDCTCVYIFGAAAEGGAATDWDAGEDVGTFGAGVDVTKVAATLVSPTSGKVKLKNNDAALGAADKVGIFGVIISGRDAAGNVGLSGIEKIVDEDVSSYFTSGLTHADPDDVLIKLKRGPIVDHDEDGDIADSIFAASDDGNDITGNLHVKTVSFDEGEIVTLQLETADIAAGSVVKISYYVADADHIIEIDESAPALTVTPTGDSTSENRRQRLTLAFDDDEYAFDSHTTTTVTKAELKDPAGDTVDILADLITSDSKSYYYKPTSDYDLGQYTLTVAGKDEHENATGDLTSKFTIKEKEKTTIAMEAGWNLISLPNTPVDSAINSVLDNTEVTTVLTYDPATPGGWLTAVRDGGSLVGTLTHIDSSRGYWIYQEDGDDIKTLLPSTTDGVQQVPPAIPVVKGWNLVPVVSLNTTLGYIEADDYFANIDWNKAQGWNATTEKWETIYKAKDLQVDSDGDGTVGDAHDTEDITTGQGYWVFANKAGTIVP